MDGLEIIKIRRGLTMKNVNNNGKEMVIIDPVSELKFIRQIHEDANILSDGVEHASLNPFDVPLELCDKESYENRTGLKECEL